MYQWSSQQTSNYDWDNVVTSEIFDVMKNREEFDLERYIAALNKLPKLPWE